VICKDRFVIYELVDKRLTKNSNLNARTSDQCQYDFHFCYSNVITMYVVWRFCMFNFGFIIRRYLIRDIRQISILCPKFTFTECFIDNEHVCVIRLSGHFEMHCLYCWSHICWKRRLHFITFFSINDNKCNYIIHKLFCYLGNVFNFYKNNENLDIQN
jgi:hypothetical protein